jgi:adenine-specific DNA-methyltransferase
MPRRRNRRFETPSIEDFRHDAAWRGNNPPAGPAFTDEVRQRKATSYAHDPHPDPPLSFGRRVRDELARVIEREPAAQTLEEAKAVLAVLKRSQEPTLVWAGKMEHTFFVDVVSLHIPERISTRAIPDAVRRPAGAQRAVSLHSFGKTPLPADRQMEFSRQEVGWGNRLISGDSLPATNSLLVKEGIAGKVQMISRDLLYGIKYASNFQPRIDRRDVKDKDEDLTHEPKQIRIRFGQLGLQETIARIEEDCP